MALSARQIFAVIAMRPDFIFFLSTAFAIIGLAFFLTAKLRAREHFDQLMQGFNTVTAKLNEAEKQGHFGSFTWDFEKKFTFWSEEMFALFGLRPNQNAPSIEKTIVLVDQHDREGIREAWDTVRKRPGPFTMLFRVTPPGLALRYLKIVGSADFNAEHQLVRVRGIAHDVTKEVEVDRAKTEFVSLASHQLKTPLTAVGWLAEGLLSGTRGPLTPQQREYIESIHETNRGMIAIVNDLLNVSRIELNVLEVAPEPMDVVAFTKEVLSDLRFSASQKQVEIREAYAEGLPQLMADKNLMRMIVQNLLTNAIKYTPSGGHVEIELSQGRTEDKVFLRVSDTGIGIPKGAQEKMFQKLFRAENAQKKVVDGTGLGMYTVKTIIDRVHGGITFDSIENRGTNFYVTLPTVWKKEGETGAILRA